MLKHLRFDIFKPYEKKLPVRLINPTNERRLVQGHETTPLRVKWDIKDVSSESDNRTKCLELYCSQLPNTAEDPPCRRDRCTLNLSRFKRPPVGVVWKLEEEGASSGVVLVI
ncbi:hypothetical protein TNCV_2584321 [Trichonephila clavipes]|nr:hypothetical protein TNCV_2584321 [Trichonephila clavipes]